MNKNYNNPLEYQNPITLKDDSAAYFIIPDNLILNKELDEKRISVFSFLSIFRGITNQLYLSVNMIAEWLGKKPDRHKNGINTVIINCLSDFASGGYLTLSEELNHSSIIKATINLDKITSLCRTNRYAIIYVDELYKILECKNLNKKDSYLSVDVILLVFAYLRMRIYKRRNELAPEERNIDGSNSLANDIVIRKQRSPEAYNCFYFEIADELGLTSRTVSKAVSFLNDLELIYSEPLPRIKHDNHWRTDHTIFCNRYKRERDKLLAAGDKYYLPEIKNKKIALKILKKGDGSDE